MPERTMNEKERLHDEKINKAAGGAFVKDGFKHDAVFGVKAGMCVGWTEVLTKVEK